MDDDLKKGIDGLIETIHEMLGDNTQVQFQKELDKRRPSVIDGRKSEYDELKELYGKQFYCINKILLDLIAESEKVREKMVMTLNCIPQESLREMFTDYVSDSLTRAGYATRLTIDIEYGKVKLGEPKTEAKE